MRHGDKEWYARHEQARKAARRYIADSASYKEVFVAKELYLEGYTAGLRHERRITKILKR